MAAGQDHISDSQFRRSWRVVTWAGLLGTIYYILCITGVPRIKYLTVLKATAFDFGLISGLGSLALAFQVFGGVIANHLRCRKPLWMALAILHRLCFAGVLIAPALLPDSRLCLTWIIAILFMHDGLAHTATPLWLSWMADLVPAEAMNRHWASRLRFTTIGGIVAMVAVALGFSRFETSGHVVFGFTILASLGILIGVTDISMFAVVPEPSNERIRNLCLWEILTQPLRDAHFRPFLAYMGYWHFAVFAAAPFFDLFMVQHLGFSVLQAQMVGVAGAIGVAVSSRFWGVICDRYGFRPVLHILSFAKVFAPIQFMLAPLVPAVAVPMLLTTTFFDGMFNSGMCLAMQGVLLKSTPRQNRTSYIAATNFLSIGIMAGIAPIITGSVIDLLNSRPPIAWGWYRFNGYHAVFALSFLLRIGSIILARRISEANSASTRALLGQLFSMRVLRATRLVYQLHESAGERERVSAARLLADLRSPVATTELINILEEDASPSVRAAAADALGSIGEPEAAEPLAKALLDPEPDIQSCAARALGHIGDSSSVAPLVRGLRSASPDAVPVVIDSLARIGDASAVVPLIWFYYEHDSDAVRQQVATALSKLGEAESPEDAAEILGLATLAEER